MPNYAYSQKIVAETDDYERAWFIQKTYMHLALAILSFIGIEAILLNLPFTPALIKMMFASRFGWLVVLGLFIVVSWIAQKWAMSEVSREQQYLGLGLYVIAEAIVFLPLLYVAAFYANDPTLIPKAGVITLLLFSGLTFIAFTSKKDFSFLGGILKLAGFVAFGFIICSMIFGFNLGTLFAGAMVVFAGGCILYDTSNIIHHYRTSQYVAASLALFASVALMFWYVLQLLLARDR